MNKLVSIISPCYNGETYVGRFIESVLNQTYDNIEFIIVNDGSTDKTEEVILSYQQRFEEKGYKFIYIYQKNAGQSAAINQALKIFTGDYLTWPDSDDFLPSSAILKQVRYLEENTEYGLVKGRVERVEDKTYKHLAFLTCGRPQKIHDFFFMLLKEFFPGGYMVRSSMFRAVMPKPLQIETPREIGQNYQMLLPVAYTYKCGVIDDVCYAYTARMNSHSHLKYSFEEQMNILDISNMVLVNISNALNVDATQHAIIEKAIEKRRLMQTLVYMLQYRRREKLDSVIEKLEVIRGLDDIAKSYVLRLKYPFYDLIYRAFCKIRRLIDSLF